MRLIALSLLTAGLTLTASPASAAVVALWHMNEPAGATTMVDDSGNNDGTVCKNAPDPCKVTTGVTGLFSGRAYQFGGTTSFVQVDDTNDSLDPGSANMKITATVKTVGGAMPDDSYDLVRKGVTTTAGGEWKMEIKRGSDPTVGKLNCVFKGVMPDGSRLAVARIAKTNVNDGQTHTLQCVKTATTVQAIIDGKTFTTSKNTGSINNTAPVIIGAKSTSDDVLQGTMDEVKIEIG